MQTLGLAFGTITVNGNFTTITFHVEGSNDNGATWFTVPFWNIQTPTTAVTSITATATGMYGVSIASLTNVRFNVDAYTGTSATLKLTGSSVQAHVYIPQGGTGGTVTSVSTNGTSGPSTLSAGQLNIPNYTTPAVVQGIRKGNGASPDTAAVADTDYSTPAALAAIQASAASANAITAAAAQSASNQAAALSPLDYGTFDCSGTETAVTTNGQYISSTFSGTDSTAALNAVIAAAAKSATPTGAIAEALPGTIYQKTIRFPDGCNFGVTSWPASIPPGVKLEGNNVSTYITTAAGHGPIWTNSNQGNVSGISNSRIENMRVVYAGPAGASTGIGAGIILGGSNSLDNLSVFGFNLGLVLAGVEYSPVHHAQIAHNRIGVALLPASFGTSSAISQTGTPTINVNITDFTIRNNGVNIWGNGFRTSFIGQGSTSFGVYGGIVLGDLGFPFIDSLAVSNGASAVCTANAQIPVVITDSSATITVPAEGIITTDASGHASGGYSINGGKGYVSPAVSVPTSVVNGSGQTVGCSTPPTVTAHVQNLSAYLPFTGAATIGSSQNSILYQNIENEGANSADGSSARPTTGFQVMIDSSASDTHITRAINGLDSGTPSTYARFLRNEGLNTIIDDSLLTVATDPATGSTCPYLSTASIEIHAPRQNGLPWLLSCGANALQDTSYNFAFLGWRDFLAAAHGWSAYGTSLYNAASDVALEGREPGDTITRFSCSIGGTCSWGTGLAAWDTSLSRSGTGTMKGTGIWGFDAISTGTTANTDLGGVLTIPAGTAQSNTYTFAKSYQNAPRCWKEVDGSATVNGNAISAMGAIWKVVSTSAPWTITIYSQGNAPSGSAVNVDYGCWVSQ